MQLAEVATAIAQHFEPVVSQYTSELADIVTAPLNFIAAMINKDPKGKKESALDPKLFPPGFGRYREAKRRF